MSSFECSLANVRGRVLWWGCRSIFLLLALAERPCLCGVCWSAEQHTTTLASDRAFWRSSAFFLEHHEQFSRLFFSYSPNGDLLQCSSLQFVSYNPTWGNFLPEDSSLSPQSLSLPHGQLSFSCRYATSWRKHTECTRLGQCWVIFPCNFF